MKGNAMKLIEKKLTSELIYDGKIVHLHKDTVELPNGNEAVREVVRHVGAVGVVPITEDGEVVLVRQYRYPFDKVLTEIPAGKLDSPDEDIVEAARRELLEETGITAEILTPIGDLYPSCAILDEVIHLFVAEGLSFGDSTPDDDEFLHIIKVPLIDALFEVMQGKICDAKTQVGILKAVIVTKDQRLENDLEKYINNEVEL